MWQCSTPSSGGRGQSTPGSRELYLYPNRMITSAVSLSTTTTTTTTTFTGLDMNTLSGTRRPTKRARTTPCTKSRSQFFGGHDHRKKRSPRVEINCESRDGNSAKTEGKTHFSIWKTVSSFTQGTRGSNVTCGHRHCHQMMAKKFYYPTTCGQCLFRRSVEGSNSTEHSNVNSIKKNLLLGPSLSFCLGFGSDGYCCTICNLSLHSACLSALDPSTYEVKMSPERKTKNEEACPDEAKLWDTQADIPASVRYIASFFFKDPIVVVILRDSFALVQRFLNRHPSIGRRILNPYRIMSISKGHDELYKLCCDALDDADFLQLEGNKGPTLQLIRDMMRFSTAVYGLAYQSGCMSSVMWSVLSRGLRSDFLSPEKAANDRAVTAILNIPESLLKESRWSQNSLEPSYCIFTQHEAKRIVWAFRGTLSNGDVYTDVSAYGIPFCGGYAHEGAAQIVSAIFDNRETEIDPLSSSDGSNKKNNIGVEEEEKSGTGSKRKKTADRGICVVCELLRQYPEYNILVTGHSLGGGVALLFGVRALRERVFGEEGTRRLRVIAFAPMPVLTMPASRSFEEQIWTIVNSCDVVCRLQLNSLDRLASEVARNESNDGATSRNMTGNTTKSDTDGNGPSTGRYSIADSLKLRFMPISFSPAHTSKGWHDTEDLTEEMHHPGRVFMLTTPWQLSTNRIVQVPRGNIVIHHLFISPHMFSEHLMDRYALALTEIHPRHEVH